MIFFVSMSTYFEAKVLYIYGIQRRLRSLLGYLGSLVLFLRFKVKMLLSILDTIFSNWRSFHDLEIDRGLHVQIKL